MPELKFHKGCAVGKDGQFVIESDEPINKAGGNRAGEVYLATGTHLHGRRVAIKFLKPSVLEEDPQILEDFQVEIKALIELEHPNIVNIVDYGKETDDAGTTTLYIAMEYVPESAEAKANLGPREVMKVGILVCNALNVTHLNGILHRDVKPDNILIARGLDGLIVKLADFGIVKLGDHTKPEVFGSSSQPGTPPFSSPEQYSRNGVLQPSSDLYSLAKSLYYLMTGVVPDAFVQLTTKDFPADRVYPQQFVELLIETTSADVSQRPQDARAFQKRLEAILSPSGESAEDSVRSLTPDRKHSSPHAPVNWKPALLIGAVLLATAGIYSTFQNIKTPDAATRDGSPSPSMIAPSEGSIHADLPRWYADRRWSKILAWSSNKPKDSLAGDGFYVAVALIETGQVEEGLKIMKNYAEHANTTEAWINMGRSTLRFDRREAATDAYQRALKLDPENVEARERLQSLLR